MVGSELCSRKVFLIIEMQVLLQKAHLSELGNGKGSSFFNQNISLSLTGVFR